MHSACVIDSRTQIPISFPLTNVRTYYTNRADPSGRAFKDVGLRPPGVRIYVCCEVRVSASMGEERGAYRVLVGKPEGESPLGKPRRRWVDNIRLDLQEVGCGYVDWIGLAQDREGWRKLVSAVMNLRVP